MPRTVSLAVCLVYLAPIVLAQGGYSVVSGRVLDTSGTVVPTAVVTARHVQTDVPINSVSNNEGYYVLSNLIPGTYTIKVQQPGFKTLERARLAWHCWWRT